MAGRAVGRGRRPGVGRLVRTVPQVERGRERHAGDGVHDAGAQRAAHVHGRRRHVRFLRAENGGGHHAAAVQPGRRRTDTDGRPRPERRPVAPGGRRAPRCRHDAGRGQRHQHGHVHRQGAAVRPARVQLGRVRGRHARLVQRPAHAARHAQRHIRAPVQRHRPQHRVRRRPLSVPQAADRRRRSHPAAKGTCPGRAPFVNKTADPVKYINIVILGSETPSSFELDRKGLVTYR